MDPLSDVLALLKPRSAMSAGLDAAGDWLIDFPAYDVIRFQAIIKGQCWLSVEGVADPVRLSAGDCFLLPTGQPFRIGSDLSLTPIHAYTLFSSKQDGIATINGGGDFFGFGGFFALTGDHAEILLNVLPPIVHLRNEAEQAALRWSLERMLQEQREQQPGRSLITQHLAQMILVQALRMYLAEHSTGVGWLYALTDPQIGAAIGAMHEDPAHRWTLQKLAECAGLSRSTFALKFKEKVGTSPLEYLTRWRMMLAGDRLTNTGDPISAIALSLGYESESAFSTAFKRVMGVSPRQYSRGRKLVSNSFA